MFYQPRLTSFSWSVFSRGGGSLGRCTAVKTRAHTQTTHAYTHTQTDTQNRKVVGVQLYFKTLSGRGTETVLDAACAIETHAQLTWLAVGGLDCFNLKSSLQPSHHISHSRGWASVDRSTPGSCTICTMISGLQIIDGSYHYGIRLLGKSVLWKKWQGLHVIHFGHFGRLLQVVFSGKLEKGKQAISFQIWPLQLQPKFFSEFWANHRCKFLGKTSPLGFVCPATKYLFDTSSPQCSLWKQPVCWKNSSFIFSNFFGYVTHHPSSCFRPLLHLHPEAFARHHGEYINIYSKIQWDNRCSCTSTMINKHVYF